MVSWLQRPPASMANKIAVEVVIAEFWACAFFSQAWALGPQARHSSVLWPGVKNIYIALLPSRPWPALVVSWGVVLQSTLL